MTWQLKIFYSNGESKTIDGFKSHEEADWHAHMEGDHVREYKIVKVF